MDYMTRNKLLTNCRHGFITGRSCSTILLNVLDAWTEATDKGIPIDAIYLDFAKALDALPHLHLLNKFDGHGTKGMVHPCGLKTPCKTDVNMFTSMVRRVSNR